MIESAPAAVSFCHGLAVELQIVGELADRRQRVARLQNASSDRSLNLLDQLLELRHGGVDVDRDFHRGGPMWRCNPIRRNFLACVSFADRSGLVGETRSPRRVSPNVEEQYSAPSGRVRRAPHREAGCGEPGANFGHEVLGARGTWRRRPSAIDSKRRREATGACRRCWSYCESLRPKTLMPKVNPMVIASAMLETSRKFSDSRASRMPSS